MQDRGGAVQLRSGNEAIARGAWEAGVAVGAGYPGTPSTEILEALARLPDVYCEWSPNEKVAVEVAVGASLGGARALATMKHVGLNVAADPLFSAAYMGVNGGLVIVSADDPGMHSSQNEQDNRFYARAARIPLLEPATPDEARRFTRAAFDLSERFDTPVLLRTTTRLSHGRGVVREESQQTPPRRAYVKEPRKNVLLPAHARVRHHEIEAHRMPALVAESADWVEVVDGTSDRAFITAGPAFLYVREAFPDAAVLKLGMTYPLPAAAIADFARARTGPLCVIEELEPFLEEQIRALGIAVESRVLPRDGEVSVGLLRRQLGVAGNGAALGELPPLPGEPLPARPGEPLPALPGRSPTLCAGCAHRNAFQVLADLDVIVAGDIGCYTLGALAPLDAMDACLNMGASIPMAHGLRRVLPPEQARRVVSVIGDSTFFHSGIAGLLDVVHNGGNGVTLVLDNATTAMTGHQDHPGVPSRIADGSASAVDIAALVRALGVRDVHVLDPYDLPALRAEIERSLATAEPSVLIARAPCVLRERRTFGDALQVDPERCTDCHACLDAGCPALSVGGRGLPVIDETLCIACGLCAGLCNDCNAGLDLSRILELVAAGRDADALAVLLDVNPLPAVSARVCPHPCDDARNALGRDHHADYAQRLPSLLERFGSTSRPGHISMRAVEQYLGDLAIAQPQLLPIERTPGPRGRVAIVGSGPGGLSAAWQLARRGVAVTIYDRAAAPGGVLRRGIPGFRLDRTVLDAELARLFGIGIRFRGATDVGTAVSLDALRQQHDAVILAVGYSSSRSLRMQGDGQATGIYGGTWFLDRFNAGESVDTGTRVAVIGGGNTALDCARAARRTGARVTIYYRRGEAEMPAIADEIEAARAEGVEIVTMTLPQRVVTDPAGRVSALELIDMVLGDVDASGRRSPVPVPGSERIIEADTVIIAVGEVADLSFLAGTGIGGRDHIPVAFTGRTQHPGVFACGDVAFGHGTVTQSISTGRRAADAVLRFLQQRGVRK
jgi:indolepyruvate ferredoxin oxidoreductase, alpha subunit